MKKIQKSSILANNFTGWLKWENSGRTWSAKSCDEWSETKAIRFDGGLPMESHLVESKSSGYQSGDKAYGQKSLSYSEYYKNESFVEPEYKGEFTRHKTDSSQQDYFSYKLYNATIVEEVALYMMHNVEFWCIIYWLYENFADYSASMLNFMCVVPIHLTQEMLERPNNRFKLSQEDLLKLNAWFTDRFNSQTKTNTNYEKSNFVSA